MADGTNKAHGGPAICDLRCIKHHTSASLRGHFANYKLSSTQQQQPDATSMQYAICNMQLRTQHAARSTQLQFVAPPSTLDLDDRSLTSTSLEWSVRCQIWNLLGSRAV
jgi:hypothetical protein